MYTNCMYTKLRCLRSFDGGLSINQVKSVLTDPFFAIQITNMYLYS